MNTNQRFIPQHLLDKLRAAVTEGRVIIVATDNDGTVTEFNHVDPSAVFVNKQALDALDGLSQLPNVVAGVVTGREIPVVQALFGLPNIFYVGNHGYAYSAPGSDKIVFAEGAEALFEGVDALKAHLLDLVKRGELPSSLLNNLEDKRTSLAINVGIVAEGQGRLELISDIKAFMNPLAEEMGFKPAEPELTTMEWMPKMERNKGVALGNIAGQYENPFTIYMGDSLTDVPALKLAARSGMAVVAERPDTRPELLEVDGVLRVPGVPGVARLIGALFEILSA